MDWREEFNKENENKNKTEQNKTLLLLLLLLLLSFLSLHRYSTRNLPSISPSLVHRSSSDFPKSEYLLSATES